MSLFGFPTKMPRMVICNTLTIRGGQQSHRGLYYHVFNFEIVFSCDVAFLDFQFTVYSQLAALVNLGERGKTRKV